MKKFDPDTHRLHGVSIFFFTFKFVKDLLYPLLAVVISTIVRGEINLLWIIGGVLILVTGSAVLGWLSWLRFTYRISDDILHVHHGLFIRKKLYIHRERVQSFDMSAGVLHRIFGLWKVQIETAGGTKPEVVLSAISTEESVRLREALYKSGRRDQDEPSVTSEDLQSAEHDTFGPGEAASVNDLSTNNERAQNTKQQASVEPLPSIRIPLRTLLLYSITSGRVGIAIAVIGAAYSQIDDWLTESFDIWNFVMNSLGAASLVWVAAALLLAVWLFSAIMTTLREYGFTLQADNGKLTTYKGLLERKQASISLKRVQGFYFKENAIRRLLGYASVHVYIAGTTEKYEQSFLLFPMIRKSELPGLLEQFLPAYQLPQQINKLTLRSLPSFLTVPVVTAVVITAAAVIWIPDGYGLITIALPLIALLWGWLRYRQTGWSVDEDMLTIRHGSFSTHHSIIPKHRVQWHTLATTPFQRRKKLGTLSLAIASGAVFVQLKLRHLPWAHGAKLMNWLRRGSSSANGQGHTRMG
ncbi:PH domain-containing protein [Paenibacillus tarimensis]|uniref:PH domain-containing protein n=1 Tax=Paenibacillus tarimensis TaxID=416012 RepID=UPI001F41C862|nr:PH domain-containing protein [Paenibacillus tarimensis]MCF2942692.1 PH domain-containing protein [Paenibacillus tarimensis]